MTISRIERSNVVAQLINIEYVIDGTDSAPSGQTPQRQLNENKRLTARCIATHAA